eukprot:PhM_4_TR281/c0_g1_i1/m.80569
MQQTKTLETMWRSSPSQGSKVDMFTSIIYDSYCSGCGNNACPTNFCCMSCEQVDMETRKHSYLTRLLGSFHVNTTTTIGGGLRHMSLSDIADAYAKYIKDRASRFLTHTTFVPWGCDFQFEDASANFDLMDQV